MSSTQTSVHFFHFIISLIVQSNQYSHIVGWTAAWADRERGCFIQIVDELFSADLSWDSIFFSVGNQQRFSCRACLQVFVCERVEMAETQFNFRLTKFATFAWEFPFSRRLYVQHMRRTAAFRICTDARLVKRQRRRHRQRARVRLSNTVHIVLPRILSTSNAKRIFTVCASQYIYFSFSLSLMRRLRCVSILFPASRRIITMRLTVIIVEACAGI